MSYYDHSERRGFPWFIVWIITFSLFAIFGIGTCTFRGCSPDYSDGYRAGVVSKLSKKGFFVKSWEGDLLVGGMEEARKGGGLVPSVFSFSVTDDAIAKKIAEIQTTGKRVRLHYRQWFGRPIGQIDTNYVIDAVETE